MKLYTIGFTKTSAESFFSRLADNGVQSVVDVRLKSDSQLSGFAKKKDLAFFLREIARISYKQELALAPSRDMLDSYKKGAMSWDTYASLYVDLLKNRQVEHLIEPKSFNGACLLCSEDTPHKCHRRLAAEYFQSCWNETIEIVHL